MRFNFCCAVAAAALFCSVSLSAFADTLAAKPAADTSKISKYRGTAPPTTATKEIGANSASGNGITSAEAFANPDRAYPASCLESPIPLGLWANDPKRITAQVVLPGDPISPDATERAYSESDVITVFRVVCSGGKSATLVEIDRPSDASKVYYPIVPGIFITNASVTNFVPRLAEDPNTFFSNVFAYNPLQFSTVLILENVYGGTQVDFNQAVTVYVDNLFTDNRYVTQPFALGAYTPSQYAEASLPLKINGYFSANWYDKAHSGEGIQTEIVEIGTASANRYMTVAWYTYDVDGLPYWLFGSGTFTAGDRSVNVTLAYESNGGFAGAFGAKATAAAWGTMVVSFPDCNTMNFSYASTGTDIPSFVPQGNGTKTWTRLTNLNGLTCQ